MNNGKKVTFFRYLYNNNTDKSFDVLKAAARLLSVVSPHERNLAIDFLRENGIKITSRI